MLEWATSFEINRLLILLIMFFVLILLGMFMDAVSMMLITVPIFFRWPSNSASTLYGSGCLC